LDSTSFCGFHIFAVYRERFAVFIDQHSDLAAWNCAGWLLNASGIWKSG
jgi:hypothetical protein